MLYDGCVDLGTLAENLGFLRETKINWTQLIDWYRQLRIVLSVEDKLDYLEQPIPPAPVPTQAGQQVTPKALAAHAAWELKTLFAQQAEQELLQTVRDFYSCKQEEGKSYLAELPKNKKLSQGASGSSIFTIELYTFPNKYWVYDTGCGTHICKTTQGLRGSWKLKPGALSLYVGNGYPKEIMGYSFYYPLENKVLVARNAKLLENSLITQEESESLEDLEIIQEEDTHPSINIRSTRTRHAPDHMCLYVNAGEHELGDLGEPANYKAALLDHESDKWLNDINVEMQSMKDNEIDMDGVVHTFKAHLVAKGFTQTYEVNYEETFSPVADIRAIRILIAIATYYDYEIWQMDVKTVVLNGHLSEEVYMNKPKGFVNPKFSNRVCKLNHFIYGLKHASRQWNKPFDDEIKKFGLTPNHDELCVYLKARRSNVTFLILYVDDILIMRNYIPMLQDVKSYLERYFAMKDLGEAAYILGIKIYRDRLRWLIGLCQSAYIEKILKIFHMENSKRGSIPIQENLSRSKSQGASTPAKLKRMQNVPYDSAMGSIMYDVRCTRTDVAFVQNITSRFQQNPGDLY
nr:hypothetical protein [Tanacetum cinerariifolium]